MRNSPLRRGAAVLVALTLLGGAAAARADDGAVLRALQLISDRIAALEARMDKLEGRTPVAAAPVAPAAAMAPTPAAPAAAAAPVAAATAVAPAAVPITAAPAALAAAPAGYVSPEAALKANWARIERKLAASEVTRLLGEPTRKLVIDGRNAWYYVYPSIGVGSVFFSESGEVSSRQSPFPWGG